MNQDKTKKIESDKYVIKDIFKTLNSPEASVSRHNYSAQKEWTIKGEDYPWETITVTDDVYDVIIKINENNEIKTYIFDKRKFGNSVKLWYLEKVLNKRSKSGKFSQLITNINLINDILTKISWKDTNISVIHEVIPVFKQYQIKDKNNKYTTISFNGSLVKIVHNNTLYQIQSSGYIGLKLNLLQKKLNRKQIIK